MIILQRIFRIFDEHVQENYKNLLFIKNTEIHCTIKSNIPFLKLYIYNILVIGHKGNLIFGYIGDIEVVCMQGRFHAYEGYPLALCTMPMKMFKLIGVETVVLTCAAGSINQSFEIGDIMLIKDHVSPSLWTLQSPLIGHNDERFGPRFPASNRIYNKPFRDLFRKVAEDLNEPIREGVYSSTGGPAYETVTELRGLGMLGADCAGMSTAHEVYY